MIVYQSGRLTHPTLQIEIMKKYIPYSVLCIASAIYGQNEVKPEFLYHIKNAHHLLSKMTIDEKIGQLCMIAVQANKKDSIGLYKTDPHTIANLISLYHVGGIIFLGKSHYYDVYDTIEQLQMISPLPLLIGIDAEYGIAMRIIESEKKTVVTFPKALTLGALAQDNDLLLYTLGYYIGMQCKDLGININFAPVVDVNTNPNNPVINSRSFGQDPHRVAKKAVMFMKGMQFAGILCCAKHFPGHGDTHKDSHCELPIIEHDYETLMNRELIPFKQLINNNVDAIMVGHLALNHYSKNNIPATLEKVIVTDLLKEELGFSGLVFTDGLGMLGYAQEGMNSSEQACKALAAGNDILLCPIDVPETINAIKKALFSGHISMKTIDEKVLKIVCAKLWTPHHQVTIKPEQEIILARKLYNAALTLVNNSSNALPLKEPVEKITVVSIGDREPNYFNQMLSQDYTVQAKHYTWDYFISGDPIIESSSEYIIITVSTTNTHGMIPEKYHTSFIEYANKVQQEEKKGKKIIFVLLCSAYMVSLVDQAQTIVVAYENTQLAQEAAALGITGKINTYGKLPVTVSDQYQVGHGLLY